MSAEVTKATGVRGEVGRAGSAGGPSGNTYFQQLLQYSADRLGKEPEILKSEQERIRRLIVDTAVGRYRTFLHAAETIQAIHTDVQSVERCLETLEKVRHVHLVLLQTIPRDPRDNLGARDRLSSKHAAPARTAVLRSPAFLRYAGAPRAVCPMLRAACRVQGHLCKEGPEPCPPRPARDADGAARAPAGCGGLCPERKL